MNYLKEVLQALGYTSEEQRDAVFQMLAEDGFVDHRLTMKQLQLLDSSNREARLDELTTCLKLVPMPKLSYEQVQGRIEELARQPAEGER